MYPTIVADFLAEVHLHLALFICGALGYLLMKRSKDVCPQRMAPPPQKKLSPDASEAEEEKKEEEVQEQPEVAQEAAALELPSELSLAVVEAELAAEQQLAQEEQLAREVAEPQVSERTVRILAKKAARKARKAQELMQAPLQAEQEAEDSEMPTEEPVVQAAPVEVEEVPAEEASEAAVLPAVEEEEVVPEEEAAAVPEEEESSKLDSPTSQFKSVDWYTIEEPDHGLDTCAEPELSTAWERSSREESLEDTGSYAGLEEEGYGGRQSAWYEYQQQPYQTWNEPAAAYAPQQRRAAPRVICAESWDAPMDEMIRSPVEAQQVYAQMYEDRLSAEQAQQSVQYQPVMCDNQQLYTDGQQYYMLACVTGAEGANDEEGNLREILPVTDAQDPLHAEFAANANPAGFVNLAMQGDQPMPVEQAEMPSAEDAAAWDICWTMTQ